MANKSLWYLFTTFLKIGSASFGGFMALIAVVQDQLVERDKVIKNETVLDGISLTSILPGPVAVNTVAYIGYQLRGVKGALVSMLGVIIPSFILICTLSHFYFEYGQNEYIKSTFKGVLPAVCAIILSVAFKMGKKNLNDYRQIIIAILAAIILLSFGGFFTTFIILIAGGVIGYLLYNNSNSKKNKNFSIDKRVIIYIAILITVCLSLGPISLYFSDFSNESISDSFSLIGAFSSISIGLFGGGYVFLPVMQEVIVNHYEWVTSYEFADGVALGQITPGPIMITATFVGYKVMGIWGALLATVGMFLPPGLLTIFCSRFMHSLKSSEVIQSAFKGIRAVVIGMILAATIIIGKDLDLVWQTFLIGFSVLGISIFTKLHVIFLIFGSGILGVILF
jgi:chromate transporter